MTSEENYSVLERMIHRLAFSGPGVQLTAADIESAMYGSRYRDIQSEQPVFVTSLPRAGTTLMLELLTNVAPLATHCYRDMPFVLAPILWDTLSKGFRKPADLKERAHGDGMLVGYDSPEAFEEILWRTFWPEKFKDKQIELWQADEDADEFRAFFSEHMQKIIALRSNGEPQARRYVSKNNANVARISLLRRMFPDCHILIPVRDPVTQARSLLRQHTRFISRHKEDAFSKRYMADIGHLEFGELHRPIAFEGMDRIVEQHSPETLSYWIAYWTAAFKHIIRFKDEILFVSYERLCERGPDALREISGRLGLVCNEARLAETAAFHEPRDYAAESGGAEDGLLSRAYEMHRELLALSIV